MYGFRDVNETSDSVILPSEAMQINGEYIENLVEGYRTLSVSGRESLSPEIDTFETGIRDGAQIKNKYGNGQSLHPLHPVPPAVCNLPFHPKKVHSFLTADASA